MKTMNTFRFAKRWGLIGMLLVSLLASVKAQPILTCQPTNKIAFAENTVSFTICAKGASTLNYQWRKDGADIPGATGATCTLGLARTNHSGLYTAVVADATGSVTSSPPAELTVTALPPTGVFRWSDDGPGVSVLTDVALGMLSGVTSIAGTMNSILAVTTDGSLVTLPPSPVVLIQDGVRAVAAYDNHIVVLRENGVVLDTGGNSQILEVPTDLTNVTAIAAGWDHTVALKINGEVVAWGDNGDGQIDVPVGAQSGVVAIAAGYAHSVALKNDGSVVAWGWDRLYGQTTVPPEAQGEVVAIAAGYDYTAVLKEDGSVMSWRRNLDTGRVSPITLTRGQVTAISGQANRVGVLKADGSVYEFAICCGVGDIALTAPYKATAIAAGHNYSIALHGAERLLPTLQAQGGDHGIVLSWPTNAVGFTLQSAPSLASDVTWTDFPSAPAVIGARFAVTDTIIGDVRFYRLSNP